MPRALPAGDLISRRVEGQRGRAEVAGGPRPLRLQQAQQVPEVIRCVGRPGGQPPDQIVQFSERSGTLVSRSASGVRGQGQAPSRRATAVT